MVGGTQVPPLGPIARWARPAERAGLGGAVARWAEWGVDRGGGAPHPLSCFPPLQRPITRQAPAPGVASRVPATPKRRVFAGKKSEQLAVQRALVAGWALRVARTSAQGRVHARGSVAIPSRVRCAGRQVVGAAGEVSSQADPGASPGRGGWGTRHTRR